MPIDRHRLIEICRSTFNPFSIVRKRSDDKAHRHEQQRKREQRLKPRNVLHGSRAFHADLAFCDFPLGQCRLEQVFFGRFAASKLGRHTTVGQNENAIGQRQNFGQFRRRHHDAQAAASQFVDERVNLALRIDVDAARRLIQ